MSLLPLLFSAWWADLDRPHRLMDQPFGLGVYPEELMYPSVLDRYYPGFRDRAALDLYYKSFSDLLRYGDNGFSTITTDKDTFKVMLDVQQFKPEEITVKVVERFVIVEAKHEEKKDKHGLISRQFVRKYVLPDQVDIDQVASNISSDGILTITAPLKETEKPNERKIKIEFTGKPAIRPNVGGKEENTDGKKIKGNPNAEEVTTTTETKEKEDTKPEK